MLATLVSEPFDESGWVYEEKYDGIRILAYKVGSKVTLLSRNDKDRTEGFPGIVATIRALPASTLLLDGEVIALDRDEISRFQMLQRGGRARYAVFDCLFLNGKDLRRETLTTRRTALEKEISDSRELILSRRLAVNVYGARAAERHAATELGAGHVQSVTESPEKRHFRSYVDSLRLAVQNKIDGHEASTLEWVIVQQFLPVRRARITC